MPVVSGQSGKFLGTNGSIYQWLPVDYNNLSNKPTIPTNNNQLTNGRQYINTSDFNILLAAATIDYNTQLSNKPTIPTNNNQLTNGANYALASSIPTNNNQLTNGANYIDASQATTIVNNALASSTIPAMSSSTAAMFLTNNGSTASWQAFPINTKVYGSMYTTANSSQTSSNYQVVHLDTLATAVEFQSVNTLFTNNRINFPRLGFYHVVATVYADARAQDGGASEWVLHAQINGTTVRRLNWADANAIGGQTDPDRMRTPTLNLAFNIEITTLPSEMRIAVQADTFPMTVYGDNTGNFRTTSVHVHNID
tara:strand:+ start:1491 stop:2423 length:933 start_codon:yes stop_codon:yes gene_type:complete